MFLSHEMKCYLQCRRQIFMFRAFLRAKNTNVLELRTLMLCLVQLSKWRESRPRMLKSFFLSERKLLNAILRVKLKYMKCFFLMKWNLFAMQKTDFDVLELFCRASHVRASMHRITWFRASKNTNDVFSATKQMKRMQGQGCWKASFSVRESC